MRVLHVLDSLADGGAETSVLATARLLRERGIDLHVAFLRDERQLLPAFARERLPIVDLSRTTVLRRPAAFAATVHEVKPDLVHTSLFWSDVVARPIARSLGVPVVTSLTNISYGPEHRRNAARASVDVVAARFADAATARFATRFHAISHTVADAMSQRLHIPRTKIDVVWRGRDASRLVPPTLERRAKARAWLGARDHEFVVVAVGRQDRQKGLDVLLHATALLRRRAAVRTIIAGRRGTHSDVLAKYVEALDIADCVTFLGDCGDVASVLAGADAFAFPSRWEGFGGALIEAMAMELPLIVSDLPVLREVAGDTAIYVAPGDPGELGSAIDLARSGVLSSKGADARQRFLERFTVDRSAEGIERIYRKVAS